MSFNSVRVVTLGLVVVAACSRAPRTEAPAPSVPRPRDEPRNGLEVVGWMRFKHPGRELRTLAFTVTTFRDSDTTTQSAYAMLPGRLRVDMTRPSKTTLFRLGRQVAPASAVDLRTLLAFDVYAQGVDTTIMWLDSARVRFGLART